MVHMPATMTHLALMVDRLFRPARLGRVLHAMAIGRSPSTHLMDTEIETVISIELQTRTQDVSNVEI